MDNKNSITIILSCFNADTLIEGYVDYYLKNNFQKHAELLVLDFPFSHKDASLVSKHIHRIASSRIFTFQRKLSLYQAWNYAIARSGTEFVSNLNLDDRVDPEYYHLAVRELNAHDAAVFSSFAYGTDQIGAITEKSCLQNNVEESYFKNGDIYKGAFFEGKRGVSMMDKSAALVDSTSPAPNLAAMSCRNAS
jgi:glycosyltransferase involved in cell wall biosynthesis